MTDGLSFETAIVRLVPEDMIDDAGQFFGNNRPGNGFIASAADLGIEPLVFRVEADGVDRRVSEGDLEILVTVLGAGPVS